jgi:hypothetical protein
LITEEELHMKKVPEIKKMLKDKSLCTTCKKEDLIGCFLCHEQVA